MTVGYIDPNFPSPKGPDDASIIIYGYTPSAPLAILALSLFSLIFLASLIQVHKYRLWSYLPLVFGVLLEITGYGFRYVSASVDPYRITFFIIQYFCITVAPVFIAASMYIYLSKLAAQAYFEGFRTKWADRTGLRTTICVFITADVLCTLLQVTGAAMIGFKTSRHKDPTTANNILIGGLAVQTLAFSLFLVFLVELVAVVHAAEQKTGVQARLEVKKCLFTLCFAGGLMVSRTIFRLCESSQGVFGYLSSNEILFGVFEFVPVVVAVALLVFWTPALLCRRFETSFVHT